jgi:Zn-dependent protease with chaperone function
VLVAIGWTISSLARRSLDRGVDAGAFAWHDLAMTGLQFAGCGVYYVAIILLGWLDWIRDLVGNLVMVDECLAILPLLCFFAALWWGAYPIERRWHDALFNRWLHTGRPIFAPPGRSDFVFSRVRNQVLFFAVPLAILLGWREVCGTFVPRLAGMLDINGFPLPDIPVWKLITLEAIRILGVGGIFLCVPFLLVNIWDTIPLGPGPLRDRLLALCTRNSVRLRELLVWRTHGTMANGAAMGLIRPIRYILLSDQLLESLSLPQLEAVMSHEVAHIRHRHILWLAGTALATVLFIGGLSNWYERLTVGSSGTPDLRSVGALTTFSLGATFLVFGAVSRRFEWQADAFALRDLSRHLPAPDEIGDALSGTHASSVTHQAAAAMSEALGAVAELNGVNPRRPDFRHGSIYSRQVRIRELVGSSLDEFPIDRTCRAIKIAACIGCAMGVALFALDFAFSSDTGPVDNNNQVVCPSPALNLSSAH